MFRLCGSFFSQLTVAFFKTRTFSNRAEALGQPENVKTREGVLAFSCKHKFK